MAFLVSKEELTKERIAIFIIESAELLRYSKVANNEREEARLCGVPARAIWCYFGRDLQDMTNRLSDGFCSMPMRDITKQ